MSLAFYRGEDTRILSQAVSKAFAALAGHGEPTSEAAKAAAVGLIAAQELVQPIAEPASRGDGLSLVDACAVIEEAGRVQLAYPLAEAIVAATTMLATRQPICESLRNASAHAAVFEWRGDAVSGLCSGANADVRWHVGLGDTIPGDMRSAVTVLFENSDDARSIEPGGHHTPPEDIGLQANVDLRPAAYVLAAADILGAASFLFDRSMAYLRDRSQFGQPLGSFQSLRHRAADDWVRLEDIRAAVDYAAALHDRGAPGDEVLQAARIAKATASEAGPILAENAIHYHGAVGFTWEFGLHFALRRIKRHSLMLGTATRHHRLIGEHYLAGLAEA